ncbi:MAG: hypothetical protein DWQ07_13660 [Chloroflexi bacterium]|nr:MAG: hypothetical protein DWQ07_13660 [Chloroflexota bacterium]MBL1197406.1 hypothetical protein [Chloroflexota bacterium]NOH14702.1 hypothetical protein [Chloroflexota bacterium]
MQFSLQHLSRSPEEASESPPLLILLHGVGSNMYDLFGLAPYLDKRFLILSAQAPNAMQPGSFAWFPILEFQPTDIKIDAEAAEASRLQVIKFIKEAVESYKADPENVYLMGFSQGCIMSMSAMLSEPELLAGVVGMSGRILPEIEPKIADNERLKDFPVLWVHGLNDNVLPISHGRAARDQLTALPVDLTYKEYQMAHEVSGESLHDVAAWLTSQLDDD